jgi:hypothetical protein
MANAQFALGKAVTVLPSRLRRMLELVYGVDGVVAARVWQSPGRIAIGVRAGSSAAPASLLSCVESAVAGLRDPGEDWDFGILEDIASAPPSLKADPLPDARDTK